MNGGWDCNPKTKMNVFNPEIKIEETQAVLKQNQKKD